MLYSSLTAQLLGGVGATILLVAYMMRTKLSKSTNCILNMIGAGLLSTSSFLLAAVAPAILNFIWFAVALREAFALYRNRQK